MKPTKTDLRVVRCAERLAEWNAGRQGEEGGDDCPCRAVVTREGVAGVVEAVRCLLLKLQRLLKRI